VRRSSRRSQRAPRRHCQSKFYTACSPARPGWSRTVFAHESWTRSAGFDAENGLYLFALTVPPRAFLSETILDDRWKSGAQTGLTISYFGAGRNASTGATLRAAQRTQTHPRFNPPDDRARGRREAPSSARLPRKTPFPRTAIRSPSSSVAFMRPDQRRIRIRASNRGARRALCSLGSKMERSVTAGPVRHRSKSCLSIIMLRSAARVCG